MSLEYPTTSRGSKTSDFKYFNTPSNDHVGSAFAFNGGRTENVPLIKSSRVGHIMSNPMAYFNGRAMAHLYVVIVLYSLPYVSWCKNRKSIIIAIFSLDSLHLVLDKNCMNLVQIPWYCLTVENLCILLNILLIGSTLIPRAIKAFLIVSTREGSKRENWGGRPFPRLSSETGEATGEGGNDRDIGLSGWGTMRKLASEGLLGFPCP